MSPRKLPEPKRVFRIGDLNGTYPIYSGEGAARVEGRWHEKGQEVIYTCENYSTAMLEKLYHYSGRLPSNQHFIEVDIPASTSYEVVTKDSLPDWYKEDQITARQFGSDWIREGRSAILIVPSVVARMEANVLINPRHDDAKSIKAGLEIPVTWDARLFEPDP